MTKAEETYYGLLNEIDRCHEFQGDYKFFIAPMPKDGETLNNLRAALKIAKNRLNHVALDLKLGVITAEKGVIKETANRIVADYLTARIKTYH